MTDWEPGTKARIAEEKRQCGGILPFTFSWTDETIQMLVDYVSAPGREWAYSNWREFSTPGHLMSSIGFNPIYTGPLPPGRSGHAKGIWECSLGDEADLQALGNALGSTPTAARELDKTEIKNCFRDIVGEPGEHRLPKRIENHEAEQRIIALGRRFLPRTRHDNLWSYMFAGDPEVTSVVEGMAWTAEIRRRGNPMHPIDSLRDILWAPEIIEDYRPYEADYPIHDFHGQQKQRVVVGDIEVFLLPMIPIIAELVDKGQSYGEALLAIEEAHIFHHLAIHWLQLGCESDWNISEIYNDILKDGLWYALYLGNAAHSPR